MRGSLHSIDQATSTRVRTAVDKAGRPPIPPPGKNLPSPGAAGESFGVFSLEILADPGDSGGIRIVVIGPICLLLD